MPAALTAADRPDLQQDFDANHAPDGTLLKSWPESNIFSIISSGDAVARVLLALDKAIAQQTPEMEMARLRRKIGSLLDDLERAGEEELSGFFADEPEEDLPEGWDGEED